MGTRVCLVLSYGRLLFIGALLSFGAAGCIVDIDDDDDCCGYAGCGSCANDSYYYSNDSYNYGDNYVPDSFNNGDTNADSDYLGWDTDTATDTMVDTDSIGDTATAMDTEDTDTGEFSYYEYYQCADQKTLACEQTICNAVETYEDAGDQCELEQCSCAYLDACLQVQILCLESACVDVLNPDSLAMVECAMDYAMCINPCK